MPADAPAHVAHPVATAVVSVSALAAAFLTVMAVMAWRRTRRSSLLFVATAFLLFTAKAAITMFALETDVIHHETLEMTGSVFDLAILGLLIAPFLRRA